MTYIFLAEGFEETEALAPADILRRGGVDVVTVGVTGKTVIGSHGIPVICDKLIDDIPLNGGIEAVVLPGGMPGTLNLEKNQKLSDLIDFAADNGKIIGAICAAPSILGHKGLLKGRNATCFPGFEKDLQGANYIDSPVVTDGNIITSFGAGAAFLFGFGLLGALKGEQAAEKIRKSMKYQ